MKIEVYLKNKEVVNTGCKLVFVPVVEHEEVNYSKTTGRKLTAKQLEKADPKDVDTKRKLVSNTEVWSENPSARIEIRLEDEADAKGYNINDRYQLEIKKL